MGPVLSDTPACMFRMNYGDERLRCPLALSTTWLHSTIRLVNRLIEAMKPMSGLEEEGHDASPSLISLPREAPAPAQRGSEPGLNDQGTENSHWLVSSER